MRADRILAALAALGLSLTAARAEAFCRTTTCSPNECQPTAGCSYCLDGGLPLYWPGGCASFSAQVTGSPLRGISGALTGDVVKTALAKWIGVDCGGAPPSLALFQTQDVVCDKQEYNQDSPNANVWMYRDDAWPYGSSSTLALTTVTFNVKTGEIYDADVEVNSLQVPLTVGDTAVQADLDSIVTHEAGHFLGLSHSCDKQATMYASYQFGETGLRSLEADDAQGICAIYPPGKDVSQCSPIPRHGFSIDCGVEPEEKGCCSTAPGGPSGAGRWALGLGLGALALGSFRRLRGGRAAARR